ncbi:MAG: biotin/lipoyl-containing protein [Paludibacter sp.]|nr:biotin/lipoyl-containing protein [Paludibacter sp.]
MKKYLITVNQNQFEVEVLEVKPTATAPVYPHRQAPKMGISQPVVASPKKVPAGAGKVAAPMPGTVISLFANPGDIIKKGQKLLVFEAMKMENELTSPVDGVISEIRTSVGKSIAAGELLVVFS